jgi:biopolymer transport protein ExbD
MPLKRFDDINVIPFIDIMLVLLAIVLTSASFVAQQQLNIDLPTSQHGVAADQPPPVLLVIDSQKQLHLNGVIIDIENLKEQLEGYTPDTDVRLEVDAQVPFDHFVSVVDTLKARHMDKLSILTRKGS